MGYKLSTRIQRFSRYWPIFIWLVSFALGTGFLPLTLAQTSSTAPSLDDILDTDTVVTGEVYRPVDLELPGTMQEVAVPATADEREEVSAWVRWLILRNLPPNYEDNRKWNRQKEIVSGLHVHRDGLKLETKRKRKMVNHGTWTRYVVEFIAPEKELVVDIQKLEFPTPGVIEVSCTIELPLKLFGRVSQWQRDLQWYSLSMDGRARVTMDIDASIRMHVNTLKFPPDVEFAPHVTDASLKLKDFEVDRVSRVGGDAAELIGKGLRKTLEDKVSEYDDKLVSKMNEEIEKQKDKLRVSLGDWLKKKVSRGNEGG